MVFINWKFTQGEQMKFEYVGYRPIISHHGITFKQGKDDKFVYFPYVYEILNSLNQDL